MNLIWFRDDLRLVDNTALIAACESTGDTLAVFISTPDQWREHATAPNQIAFIERRIDWLTAQLLKSGITLIHLQVPRYEHIPSALIKLVKTHAITSVFANKQYAHNEVIRDGHVESHLKAHQVLFRLFDDRCIIPPSSVLNKQGEMYKVFTPFRNAWLKKLQAMLPHAAPKAEPACFSVNNKIRLTSNGVPNAQTERNEQQLDKILNVDDHSISAKLNSFCEERISQYAAQRDYPSIEGTSQLSPYLAIGALSSRQCLASIQYHCPKDWLNDTTGAFSWLNELIWREFYLHLVAAFPKLGRNEPFQPWATNIVWQNNPDQLNAWQQGKTGFPLIDAAMKQLLTTGWMHNRLRMVVASFLTKDLLIDWREGERWFMQHLIDGDYISNNGGWQWAASTGVDAQPYFRIFNPIAQSEKFDPEGQFIRHWLPELDAVPKKYIHEPQKWVNFHTVSYPDKIIDRVQARNQALIRFKTAKETWKEDQEYRK